MWFAFVRAVGMVCLIMALLGTALSFVLHDPTVIGMTILFWLIALASLLEKRDNGE